MKILIIDDDRIVCQSIKLLLTKAGYEVETIYNPLNAVEHIERFQPNLLLLDMNFTVSTTGEQGLQVLKRIKTKFPNQNVILITGWGTMELAIEGMKLGAKDFITKPWDNQTLLQSVESILAFEKPISPKHRSNSALDKIIGESKQIKDVKVLIQKIASTNATVLITGESGTGKELVAEAIHESSKRSREAFVKVNLGGLAETLFESELFGYKKGAFTGAIQDRDGRFKVAHKGSIFLDEIGDVPMSLQVKLLRVLQEKTFEPLGSSKPIKTDVRVISATHKNLPELIANQQFREDLYYRINLIHVHLPSLVERREDIPYLANHFIDNFNQLEKKLVCIEDEAIDWLTEQDYSGNIRQLKNIIERAYLLSSKNDLTIKDFKPHFEQLQIGKTTKMPQVGCLTLDEMEKEMIEKAMLFHKRNISLVAKSLGITRSSLYRRLEKFEIDR